jgi:glycosyltransferase involved in cell wall biosynthesis
MAAKVTAAIPVLNGARYLDEVLAAVRRQQVDGDVEILIFDSGSTDGSLEIANRHGARVHSIEPSEFSHGGTRNQMAAMAAGEIVAFITQDATPAHDGWLAALLEGFDVAEDVAAVFGPHLARPDASHMIKAEMERHFATWGGGTAVDVQRLDRSQDGILEYRAFPGRWTFLSDVNCAVSKSALERVPYRDIPYAEDQLLGRELIEAGYAKVFHPRASVLHSHDYPPIAFFKRYFDEFRSLREVLDHTEEAGLQQTLRTIFGLTRGDARWLREHGLRGRALIKPVAVSARHHTIRMAGAIVGSRADVVPAWARRRLSLEGRATFKPSHVPESLLLDSPDVDLKWHWEFIRRSSPGQPAVLRAHGGRPPGPMTINWVIPTWGVGSGGHTTVFRLIDQLERRGHRCAIYVFDPFESEPRPAQWLRDEIAEHFVDIEAPVFKGFDDWTGADIAIATQWWTAYPLRDLPDCLEKVYLVQDDETQFYATSAEQLWVRDTYRMGYHCVAYTPWMARLLENRHGIDASWFECGTDLDTYTFADESDREEGLIAVYARRETGRRAVDIALAGLGTLYERRPGVRVVLFGSKMPAVTPFPANDLEVVHPSKLARLYRRAQAGVVFSLTTHSLVAHEMMASGLPVVELAGENVESALGRSGELARLAETSPDSIADELEAVLDDRAQAAAMARRARAFVEQRTWARAADQVESALQKFLAQGTSDDVAPPVLVRG